MEGNEKTFPRDPNCTRNCRVYNSCSDGCYTYYADGVLVDEDEDPLEIPEIATSIGLDFASHFGDYDEDSVHIRNDMRHIDYEIVRDLRKYGDFHESE